MNYYSTGKASPPVDLRTAVVHSLAPDKGLYMPERIPALPSSFFEEIPHMSLVEIGQNVAFALFGEDVPKADLDRIVREALTFDCPIVPVEKDIYALELFHGPTLAFKDVGARFMAKLLGYLLSHGTASQGGEVNVLVATSGDTGSAIANGFLGVEGIHVWVLYPSGRVSPMQESQFTTLGGNITAVEVNGAFDDCQALVKAAFMDKELNSKMFLTSANSINLARLLPQSFYYFGAYASLRRQGRSEDVVICVPSGNFGNICSGLIAKRMGLPVSRFIAANNSNDVFFQYLRSGIYSPRPSVTTYANAMDVGAPSNFARILDLYGDSHERIIQDVEGGVVTDDQILKTIRDCRKRNSYLLD
ncbi:MAG: threonine synthase, partial [Bacteroidales bacterium]|nr:threonine synthase [Bacteroidales bacterium]